jgi:hypothetical protein
MIYQIGDVIYLRVRDDALRGMITSITLTPGCPIYFIKWGDGSSSTHYEIEITTEYIPDFGAR